MSCVSGTATTGCVNAGRVLSWPKNRNSDRLVEQIGEPNYVRGGKSTTLERNSGHVENRSGLSHGGLSPSSGVDPRAVARRLPLRSETPCLRGHRSGVTAAAAYDHVRASWSLSPSPWPGRQAAERQSGLGLRWRSGPAGMGQRDEGGPQLQRLEPLAALAGQLSGSIQDREEGLRAPEIAEPRAATTQRHEEQSSRKDPQKEEERSARHPTGEQGLPAPGRRRGDRVWH
jgi:hypothetical protein